jgi:hypothetical protein
MEQHKERTIDYLFAIKESAAAYLDKFGILSVDFSRPIAPNTSDTESEYESDLSFSRKSSRISQQPRASGNRSPARRRMSPIKDPVRRNSSTGDSQKGKGRTKTLAMNLVRKAIELQNREKNVKPKYFKYLKKVPYPRNVRMFRDNYLYKSYQQAILKSADI